MTEPSGRPPLRLRVEVASAPQPAFLRAAIAAQLAGESFPGAAENAVGRAVAQAVRDATDPERSPWR